MSCGSTTCNSTDNLKSDSPSFPDLKWSWNILVVWLAKKALQRERPHQRRQLLELGDRLLADIGVSRTATEEAHRSPLYLIAWRNRR